MHSNKASNAVLTMVRAKFGRRITVSMLNNMASLHSVSELAEYLRTNTRFSNAMEQSGITDWHRGSLEAVLNTADISEIYQLCNFEKKVGSPVFQIFCMRFEADEIFKFLRFFFAGRPEEYILSVLPTAKKTVQIDLDALAQVKSKQQFLKFLNRYELYRKLANSVRGDENDFSFMAGFEANLDRLVYQESCNILKRRFSGKDLELLLRIVSVRYEITDIQTIFRAKFMYNESPDLIKSLLVSEPAYVSKSTLNRLIQCGQKEEFLSILSGIKYFKNIKVDEDNLFLSARRQMLAQALNCVHFSGCCAAVTLAYIDYIEIERQNIIRIIEGIRYGFEKEQIMNDLIVKQEVE